MGTNLLDSHGLFCGAIYGGYATGVPLLLDNILLSSSWGEQKSEVRPRIFARARDPEY